MPVHRVLLVDHQAIDHLCLRDLLHHDPDRELDIAAASSGYEVLIGRDQCPVAGSVRLPQRIGYSAPSPAQPRGLARHHGRLRPQPTPLTDRRVTAISVRESSARPAIESADRLSEWEGR